jgi:phage terminase small subunit
MPGRRPKSKHLKVITGNPGRRPLPETEPTPPEGPIVRPASVQYRAAEIWDQFAPICIALGTLTTADVLTFANYCRLQAKCDEVGPAEMSGSHLSNLRALATALGLDAPGRAKLGMMGNGKPADPADKFFTNGKKTG